MLTRLSIRDIVLVERLDLDLGRGFTALTGETGAGKSILLDSLALALGERADRGMVRHGAAQGTVTATFDLAADHPAHGILDEQGIGPSDGLVLRRVVSADGKSRAFVDDEAVSLGLLRRLGQVLVDIHGQFDQHALLDPAHQRDLLDAFAGLASEKAAVATCHAALRSLETAVAEVRARLAAGLAERDRLVATVDELDRLKPEPGEEEALLEHRTRLQQRDRLLEVLKEARAALAGSTGATERLSTAQRRLERGAGASADLLDPAVRAIERALVEVGEAETVLDTVLRDLLDGEANLEAVEDRLFALRDAARKYRVPVEGLCDHREASRTALAGLERGGDELGALETQLRDRRQGFAEAVAALSIGRAEAAGRLAAAVEAELAPLRLEKARFRVSLQPLPSDEHGPEGGERLLFEVRTNPGQPFGPLGRIASGGELARFMLALKVVLSRLEAAPTLVFDEIDSGIGGATADAVGERLARLARERQVLAVTHAPQVAARASRQLRVAKHAERETTQVDVGVLSQGERVDEIARMLAGAEITDAARKAAKSLMAPNRLASTS